MFNSRNKILISIVLISTLALVTVAQEPGFDYIDEQMDRRFAQIRLSARRAYLGLISYPQDVREAMLELATHPELVVKLAILSEQKLGEHIVQPTTVFKPYPKDVQDAGKLLLFHREIVGLMQEHLVMTSLMGEVYKNDKAKIKQLVNQIAEAVLQEHEESIDIWTERLQENPQAVEQLIAAAKAYARETTPEQVAAETNFEVSEDGEGKVYDLPSSNFVTFVLNNTDQYPYVSDEFLGYYGSYRYHPDYYASYRAGYRRTVTNTGPYRGLHHLDDIHDSVGNWLQERPHIQPADLPEDPKARIEQLREQGRFDKEFAKARRERRDLGRDKFLRENKNRFPDVAKRVNEHRVRTKDPKSRRRYQHERSKTRRRRAGPRTSTQRARVRRGPTTRQHHVSRGQRYHQRAWQQPRAGSRGSSGRQRSGGGSGRRGR